MTAPALIGDCARCPDKTVPVEFCDACKRWLCTSCLAAHKDAPPMPAIWDTLKGIEGP